jgi:hypothetical protein
MSKESIITTVRGVELSLLPKDWRGEGGDLWAPLWGWDGPSQPRPIGEWEKVIKDWEVARQVEAGFEVWNLSDDRPKYWGKRQAVFRTGRPKGDTKYYFDSTHMVHTRNGKGDPGSLYAIQRGKCAAVTPEVEAAIEKARALHAEAVEARKRWEDARRAIPVLPEDLWTTLPVKPGAE